MTTGLEEAAAIAEAAAVLGEHAAAAAKRVGQRRRAVRELIAARAARALARVFRARASNEPTDPQGLCLGCLARQLARDGDS